MLMAESRQPGDSKILGDMKMVNGYVERDEAVVNGSKLIHSRPNKLLAI